MIISIIKNLMLSNLMYCGEHHTKTKKIVHHKVPPNVGKQMNKIL